MFRISIPVIVRERGNLGIPQDPTAHFLTVEIMAETVDKALQSLGDKFDDVVIDPNKEPLDGWE
jgi:hypothetical protein